MKNIFLFKSALAVTGVVLIATGCAAHQHVVYPSPPVAVVATAPPATVYVTTPPPPPRVEVIAVTPGPGYVWIGGAWYWDNRWSWRSGYWARPPRFGAVWVGPRYVYHGGRRMWYGGYWR